MLVTYSFLRAENFIQKSLPVIKISNCFCWATLYVGLLPRLAETTRGWIGLSSVLRPHQHSIGYMGDGFTGQKTQPTVSK